MVLGKYAHFIASSRCMVKVQPFSPNYNVEMIEIVDASVLHECPFSENMVVFVIKDILHVIEMDNNLILPFIIREVGVQIEEVLKIHVDDLSVEDHAIVFKGTGFRIPLSLHGIFSSFPTTKPSVDDLNGINDVYL